MVQYDHVFRLLKADVNAMAPTALPWMWFKRRGLRQFSLRAV